MKFPVFERIIKQIQSQTTKEMKAFDLGLDMLDWADGYITPMTLMFRAYYGKEAEDWISWFIYERIGFEDNPAGEQDTERLAECSTIEQLWNKVETMRCSLDYVEYDLSQDEPEKSEGGSIKLVIGPGFFGRIG